MAKKKPDDDLDMTTSFADMNVDGFKWYNPKAKKQNDMKKVKTKVKKIIIWLSASYTTTATSSPHQACR